MTVDPRHELPPQDDAFWLQQERNLEVEARADLWAMIKGIIGIFVPVILILLLVLSHCAARDLDGHYATQNPDLHAWFDQLASGKGLCCSFVDGVSIKDVDWDTATVADASGQSHVVYRVRLNGQWIDVPPDAVVTEPNKFGAAVVWPYQDADGKTQIRCFLPGAGS